MTLAFAHQIQAAFIVMGTFTISIKNTIIEPDSLGNAPITATETDAYHHTHIGTSLLLFLVL